MYLEWRGLRWAERTVRMVDESFPYAEDAPWPLSQRYLLHALECIAHIKQQHMTFFEAALLLQKVGVYFYYRGQYEDVEPLYQQAQTIIEQVEGPNTRSHTAAILIDLANLYHNQGKYGQAEPLYQRALAIANRGPRPPRHGQRPQQPGMLYQRRGSMRKRSRFTSAPWPSEQRWARPPRHGQSLNNLAVLYADQGIRGSRAALPARPGHLRAAVGPKTPRHGL